MFADVSEPGNKRIPEVENCSIFGHIFLPMKGLLLDNQGS
jgi:hypothetical protein